MANNKNKINEKRIEFDLKDFLIKKLSFENNTLFFGTNVRVGELSKVINIPLAKVIKDAGLKKDQTNHVLDDEQIAEIAINNNFEFEKIDDISEENVVEKILDIMKKQKWSKDANVTLKSPVITIMGHVDHGKTTLLDCIRKSKLTSKEVGGITQTIGAYQVEKNGKKLTFIDTPGHEAFTEMRANGSKVTDIAIIVVAVDDSIMPQTRESIDHALAANVPIIVAVNKMDKPNVNIDKVVNEMMKLNIVSDKLGGDVPFVPISALKGDGIDKLLETIILASEVLDLKAPQNILASGTVIESNVHKQKGNLVSVIVQNGTLKVGDTIIMDDFIGKVKALNNDSGFSVKEALPGMPIEIYGLGNSPMTGSKFVVSKSAKDSQKIADTIHFARLNKQRKRSGKSVEDLFMEMDSNKKDFNIILKANALGVLEAISSKIIQLSSDDTNIKIIRKDVGEISSTDITLASASNAHIYTFNVKTPQQTNAIAKNKGINILEFDIIYKIFEDIEEKINGLKVEKFEEKEIGRLEVQKIFSFSKIGKILGSIVKSGSIKRNSLITIERNGEEIFSSAVESLKVEKDNVKEVSSGRECGVVIKDLKIEVKEGDVLIAKELISK